jgi:O-antigen/teichoic acid export membrane protein
MYTRRSNPEGIAGGTARVFLAEALLFPTGLVTAAFLTRKLGPSGYGLFTLAATIVAWIEWSITAIFGRATFKLVGEAKDWHPVGVTVVRLHLILSVAAALLLWLLSGPLARLLHEPILAWYLRLFAIDIPIFSLAQAHRNILVGIHNFTGRAVTSAGRWIARLILIVVLVLLGMSIEGAIVGSIGASLVELIISRFYVKPSFFAKTALPFGNLWEYALPLFLFALSMRFYDKLDLMMLKMLGGTAALAGIYGAAQNLSLIPSIFALSFSPLLLASLSRALSEGRQDQAKKTAQNGMKIVLVLFPFAAIAVGASHELVQWIFGAAFAQSADLFSILFFAALALSMISVTTAILTAASRPGLTFALAGPLVPLAIVADFAAIPRFGAIGAATVTLVVAALGALASLIAVHAVWRIAPPVATLIRSIGLSVAGYGLSVYWPSSGALLPVKLVALSLCVGGAFLLFGEFNRDEIRQSWSEAWGIRTSQ